MLPLNIQQIQTNKNTINGYYLVHINFDFQTYEEPLLDI